MKTRYDRFITKVNKNTNNFGKFHDMEEECWEWTAFKDKDGYGRFTYTKGKQTGAHRWSYEYFYNTKIGKFDCHHECYNTWCVNPKHLKILNKNNNILDSKSSCLAKINKLKEYCPKGHPYNEDNTILSAAGKRHCYICSHKFPKGYLDVYCRNGHLKCKNNTYRRNGIELCKDCRSVVMNNVRSNKKKSNFCGVEHNGINWFSRLTFNKNKYYLGSFSTEKEAAIAYNNKARELGLLNRIYEIK